MLDDGFQHRQLARDIDILLLSRRDLTDHLLPAGNLREALRAAKRAAVIAIPADEPELEAELKSRGWKGINLAPAPLDGNPIRPTIRQTGPSSPSAASRALASFFKASNLLA